MSRNNNLGIGDLAGRLSELANLQEEVTRTREISELLYGIVGAPDADDRGDKAVHVAVVTPPGEEDLYFDAPLDELRDGAVILELTAAAKLLAETGFSARDCRPFLGKTGVRGARQVLEAVHDVFGDGREDALNVAVVGPYLLTPDLERDEWREPMSLYDVEHDITRRGDLPTRRPVHLFTKGGTASECPAPRRAVDLEREGRRTEGVRRVRREVPNSQITRFLPAVMDPTGPYVCNLRGYQG